MNSKSGSTFPLDTQAIRMHFAAPRVFTIFLVYDLTAEEGGKQFQQAH